MEFVFRKLSPAGPAEVQPGEVYLVPKDPAQRGRRDLAQFVLEHGYAGLLAGPAPLLRLVLDVDPKLDDMLAATFVQHQLDGQPLRPGCQAFARYAAILRDGVRPASFPLEQSLEGVYLAMRSQVEKPLSDPDTALAFLADWRRLANVIFESVDRHEDPFAAALFSQGAIDERSYSMRSINRGAGGASGTDFTRELLFLAEDLDVYRQDFLKGESWQVRLPGSAAPSPALLLHQPKSLLFKYWTRSPCLPPMNGPYPFVAVCWGNGQWQFSAGGAPKLSLKPLAEVLQAAERKAIGARADGDPWFDGKPQYTLVAAPRNGTHLPDAEVLRLTRKWCRGRSLRRGRRLRRIAAAVVGCLAIAVAMFLLLRKPPVAAINSQPLKIHDLHVLAIGVSKYENLGDNFELPNAAKDAEDLAAAFKNLKGDLCAEVASLVLTNKNATKKDIINTGLKSWLLRDQALTQHSLVIVTFSGHGFIEDGSNRYHFAPEDYDRTEPALTGLFWEELQRYLKSLPCPVVVFFDTCHSGAIDDSTGDDPLNPRNPWKSLQKSVNEFRDNNGLVVMAACASYQLANDTQRWGHGALTLAVLEGIGGGYLYVGKGLAQTPLPQPALQGIVTLKDLDIYVKDRVSVLSSEISSYRQRGQITRTYSTGNISLEQIPIAHYKTR